MARYSIDEKTLTDIADAVRAKSGVVNKYEIDIVCETTRFRISFADIPFTSTPDHYRVSATDIIYGENTSALWFAWGASSSAAQPPDTEWSRDTINTNYIDIGKWDDATGSTFHLTVEALDADNNIIATYYTPTEMAEAIDEMMRIPASALNITNGKQNIFAYNNWNWFIEQCGDRINFRTDNGKSLFLGCNKLINIPFDIHVDCIASNRLEVLNDCFSACVQLEKYPNIYFHSKDKTKIILGKLVTSGPTSMEDQFIFLDDSVSIVGFNYSFLQGYKSSYPPNWLFDGTLNIDWDAMRADSSTFGTPFPVNMGNATWLRTMPFFKEFYTTHTNSSEFYHPWYQFSLQNCYSLEEIVLPRPGSLALNSNKFNNKTSFLSRMKSFKFDVQEDGTPYTAQWKLQTLDLTTYFGYAYTDSTFIDVGFSQQNKITNEEQWRAYVDGTNPDAWSSSVEYATYGASAARETLASLPDTSGYGTNIIKFKRANASAIPGEHIETNLTEEDIAVAAAKGWTVSLV